MAITKYTYNVTNDFPSGKVNIGILQAEIQSSSIVTAIDRIDSADGSVSLGVLTGGTIDIWFKAALSAGDKTILDGDTTGPCGGLIASHDNSPTPEDVAPVKIDNIPRVIGIKPDQENFSRIYIFSCDFTKKETWYLGSEWFSDSFEADGIQKTFNLSRESGNAEAIIDLSHGKITDEQEVVSPSGGSYIPIVKINGAPQVEREVHETTGGHFTVDYTAGELTFLSAPPSGNTVTFEGWYSPANAGPVIMGGPTSGKKWVIDAAEIQFSSDVIIGDAFVQNVLVDIPIFDGSGNFLFTATDQKIKPDTEYINAGNVLDYTFGSFAVVPAFGGSERGMQKDTIILRWDYPASLELKSSLNMRFRAWTKHNRGYSGERAVVTIYGVEANE